MIELPDEPLVSAVIAVYNGEPTIGAAIDSVLAQTWSRLECIVIDDGSSDGTRAAVERRGSDSRLRYVHQENRGVAAARNAGLATSQGELIAFLDADDVWLPAKLATQLRRFRERPELALVFSGYAITDDQLRPRSVVLPRRGRVDMLQWLMLEGDGLGLSFTGMVRAGAVSEVGGFDTELSTSADLEFACRVAEAHEVDVVPDVLSLYRTHRGQMHADMDLFEHDMVRIHADRLGHEPGRHRRATANLYTRIFYNRALAGDAAGAARAAREVIRRRPSRLVALPTRILVRRIERLVALVRLRLTHRLPGSSPAAPRSE